MFIRISDFNYNLPDCRIAKHPVSERDKSKLLIYNKGVIKHDVFHNITDYLPKGALMVFNNTRVIRARMHFRKETGALIEIFLLEPYAPADYEQMFQAKGKCQWLCLIGNKKKWKEGLLRSSLSVQSSQSSQNSHSSQSASIELTAEQLGESGTSQIVEFTWNSDLSFAEIVDLAGELPIPPYLNRKTEESDLTTYQTVYSKIKGSVAAPTAGLHFTPTVLSEIDALGIEREEVTLHVGAGTFKPVKTEDVADHEMHAEHFAVKLSTIRKLIKHNAQAIAVGTTSVRTLESLYYLGCQIANGDFSMKVGQWEPYEVQSAESSVQKANSALCTLNSALKKLSPLQALQAIERYLVENELDTLHATTQIIITPAGYEYKIVKMLVTNFHQPQSTLLLLVSALIGDDWRKVYDYALANDFRFLSYGDSSLLIP